jgi:hypothetical protein
MLSAGLTILCEGISFLMGQQVKLYVKSKRKAVGNVGVEREAEAGQNIAGTMSGQGGVRSYRHHRVEMTTVYEYVLPDDQRKAVELLEEIAPKNGFEVVVIDLGRFSRFGRAFSKEFRGLRVLPTLKTYSGRTLTRFTTQDVETFLLSETASARGE